MVVPILYGVAIIAYVAGVALGITLDNGVIFAAGIALMLATAIPGVFLEINHHDATFRRDVRADLTAQHVHVLGVSRDWTVQYLAPKGYCTAHVDSFDNKYIVVHETERCVGVAK